MTGVQTCALPIYWLKEELRIGKLLRIRLAKCRLRVRLVVVVGPNKDHVLLKLDHLGEEVLESKLPGICELSRTFAHVDPVYAPIPVVPPVTT